MSTSDNEQATRSRKLKRGKPRKAKGSDDSTAAARGDVAEPAADRDRSSNAVTPPHHNDKWRKRTGSSHRKRTVASGSEGEYPDDDRPVGYKNPPKDTRFQKGNQAARGRGRPKGSRNRATEVTELANFKHAVTMPDGKTRTMTLWEARVWKLGIDAARGNIKALAQLTELYDRFGVALPEAPVLAEPLTQDEDAALQQLFVDWAMENPDGARDLLGGILAVSRPGVDAAAHAAQERAPLTGAPSYQTNRSRGASSGIDGEGRTS
ncbi:DUF5681 domain-containing protein [Neoaquamicrobium sediminum]|uniref:DUF5681 domain-containing protein n=1 Tax=Neoaquamicrobium sediminum TaxID=1849104 RepID=UPI003BAABE70